MKANAMPTGTSQNTSAEVDREPDAEHGDLYAAALDLAVGRRQAR